MGKSKCLGCEFSSGRSDYLCNYCGITGKTRKAQPPEECTYFRPMHHLRKLVEKVMEEKPEPEVKNRLEKYDWSIGRELHAMGLNDGMIAKTLGCKSHTVYLWRKRNGLPPNAQGRPKKEKQEE